MNEAKPTPADANTLEQAYLRQAEAAQNFSAADLPSLKEDVSPTSDWLNELMESLKRIFGIDKGLPNESALRDSLTFIYYLILVTLGAALLYFIYLAISRWQDSRVPKELVARRGFTAPVRGISELRLKLQDELARGRYAQAGKTLWLVFLGGKKLRESLTLSEFAREFPTFHSRLTFSQTFLYSDRPEVNRADQYEDFERTLTEHGLRSGE